MLTKFLIFALFAMSLNLIWGYTGLISLGHAAFFGVGGYTSAILIMRYGIGSFWISGLGGILMAGLFAALFGIIALRVSGIYFLLVTLALGQLVYYIAMVWRPMTERIRWHRRHSFFRILVSRGLLGMSVFIIILFWPFSSSLFLFYTG